MDIIISNSSDKPLYEQITSQIKNLIMNGSLNAGDALPSMRLLAKECRISLITTKRAYEELEREGFIETISGRGSYVAHRNTELIKEAQVRLIEEKIQAAVDIAKSSGISKDEMKEILSLLYEEVE
ncbi:MAG: GntR family transcriptional regulator [Erysipelotrichaceae bacterium]